MDLTAVRETLNDTIGIHKWRYMFSKIQLKKGCKWVLLYCTVGYKWITVMDGVKFEFNGIISLKKKNDYG